MPSCTSVITLRHDLTNLLFSLAIFLFSVRSRKEAFSYCRKAAPVRTSSTRRNSTTTSPVKLWNGSSSSTDTERTDGPSRSRTGTFISSPGSTRSPSGPSSHSGEIKTERSTNVFRVDTFTEIPIPGLCPIPTCSLPGITTARKPITMVSSRLPSFEACGLDSVRRHGRSFFRRRYRIRFTTYPLVHWRAPRQ